MNYSLGNMLSRGGALNPNGLSLDLAFAADKTLTARRGPTPTFTRASTATFVGSNGLIQSAAINTPRFDHDPVTLACKGLLIEESRTNALLNSDTLSTQTVTVTAAARTLSFYGTGTVVLSGAAIATVTGTGAYPTRTTLTFTPTAGSLTLTVTGSVTQAQLEVGSSPTSYIPTTTAALTRSADVCSITGGDFTGFWNQSEGTLFASGITQGYLAMASSGANANQIAIFRNPSPLYMRFDVAVGGAYGAQIAGPTITGASFNKIAGSYALNDVRAAFNGALGTQDTTVTIPSNLTTLNIGSQSLGVAPHNGHVARIQYFRKLLPNAKLQSLTT